MADNTTATTAAQESVNEQTQESTIDTTSLQAELDRLKSENAKLKNAQSNASADASRYKKELQARMSEQERADTQTQELIKQLQEDNAALKRAQTLAEQKAGYIGLGLDAANAEKAAAATYDGDFANLTAALKDFLMAHDKALLADAVRQTPRPGIGASEQAVTREQFDKMGYSERMKLYNEQPDLYNTLTNRRNE